MKKLLITLVCVMLALLFVSCGGKNDITESNDSSGDLISWIYKTPVYDMFELSKNIFTGKLVSFEFVNDDPDNTPGDYYEGHYVMKVDVDGVYKGDYSGETTIEAVYPMGQWEPERSVFEKDFLKIGCRYFFMLDVDEESRFMGQTGVASPEYNIYYSPFKMIKLLNYGEMGFVTGKNENVFGDTFSEFLGYAYFWEIHANTFEFEFGWPHESALSQAYSMADNVFFGEVLEYKEKARFQIPGKEPGRVYCLKVKVKAVYKGEYNLGDVVEIYSLYYDGSPRFVDDGYSLCTLFFSGGEMDELLLEYSSEEKAS